MQIAQGAAGGQGCSHTDVRIAALTQGAWRRSEPSGEVVHRRPVTGNRTPTPSEHSRQGRPSGGSYKGPRLRELVTVLALLVLDGRVPAERP